MANPFREFESDPGWQYLKVSEETRMKDQSRPYDSKKDCWIPDAQEGFVPAQIVSTKGDMVTVSANGGEQTLKKDKVQEMNPPKFDKCEDMSNLSFLNDASVLGNLRQRYGSMLIYTYSGLFCVVINPYKRLPIYTESVANMFMGKRKTEMPPHLFATSDEAYRSMLSDRENQSMLITGESGAGKTENTKKVISYFAFVGASQSGPKKEEEGKKKVSLEDQIVQTNPVLEAFGNAKTVRNNNSSRFGKFIRIHFSGGGKVASCDIEHYLLEKSRVVRQAPGERCYHIFYQIYASEPLRKKLELTDGLEYYHFISQAELTIPGVNDKEEFDMMDEAFDILNFSPEEKLNCYMLMAAHMHMGEMKFQPKSSKDEQAVPNQDAQGNAEKAARMFGVDVEALLKALCSPRVKVGTEWVNKGQTVDQVNWAIGAMGKGGYDRVFTWLVNMCNKTLDAKDLERKFFIGVLDIAGFEIFDFNSFEQLWINFVNEKLQQFFNHHMFVLEQEEYKREGIEWVFIDFGLDLAACIQLIEQPMGIISMLDEECVVPKGTDNTLAQKLVDKHLGKHPNFIKPNPPKGKQAEAHFAMAHYAGLVRYNVMNWLEKNKDPLNDTCVTVYKAQTGNPLLLTIWSDYQTQEEAAAAEKAGAARKKGKSGSMMTVSMKYREGLNNLMGMLNATHPSFVRCLIPNELKKSGMLDAALVMNQLTCNGVLEGIRICRKGFPNRTQHEDFKQRYALLAPDAVANADDVKEASAGILKSMVKKGKMEQDSFRVGHTKVFFKAGILAHMEDLRDEKLAEVMLGLQTNIRSYCGLIQGRKRQEALDSYSVVQENIRNWAVLRNWPWYQVYGWLRPQLNKGKEEIEKLKKKIAENEKIIEADKGKSKELEDNLAELEKKFAALEQEMADRNSNANMSKDKAAALETDTRALQSKVDDLDGIVGGLESKNGEAQRACTALQAEVSDLKSQRSELEKKCHDIDSERESREGNIGSLESEKAKAEDTIARLNRETKELTTNNHRLRDDMEAAESKAAKLSRDKNSFGRKTDDVQDLLGREQRQKSDIERANQALEDELRQANEKLEAMNQQVAEAEEQMRQKEQDSRVAIERLRDESIKVGRLEQQLIDLSSAFTSFR